MSTDSSTDTGYSGGLNMSSEQEGGNMMSELTMMGFSVCCCTVCVLSIIMIMIINGGNHCKNRGGKKG
jgi:hypothetical protein